ncbi:desi1 [Symbiodinium natans]|uniref:Desi1 protein n=1 Tax=Symbiodinium natans TaxID=878477 RepID=A0A812Q8T0_9DINO|nr:desi1 [Symbiodinium natans]
MQTLDEFLQPEALVTLDEFLQCDAEPPTLDEFLHDDGGSRELLRKKGASAKRDAVEVYLYMYDISDGLAGRWTRFKGIWHTGVVVRWPTKFPSEGTQYWQGKEIYVSWAEFAGYTNPAEKRFLGYTSRSCAGTLDFVNRQRRKSMHYHLLYHNCNHFSDALAMFLLNKHIPKDVLGQPQEALRSYPLLTRLLLCAQACCETWLPPDSVPQNAGPGALPNARHRA